MDEQTTSAAEATEATTPEPKVEARVDSVTLVFTQTQYVDGVPVAETHSQPVKVFLAAQPALRAAISGMLGAGGGGQ